MNQPGTPVPSGNSSNAWKAWIVEILLSIILLFYKKKLNRHLAWRHEVEKIVHTAELVLDVVEKVAEDVAEITDDLGYKLPDGGRLKDAINLVEHVAGEIAKNADIAEDLLQKVEKVEKEVGALIEPCIIGQVNKVTKDAAPASISVDNNVPRPKL